MKNKYPKRIIDTNNHYLLHKVNKADINDRGSLSFKYEDASGKIKLQGPFYLSNVAIPANEELKKHGLEKAEDIKYLIAYHCGAFPNGHPGWLLKSEENIPDDFYEKVLSIH